MRKEEKELLIKREKEKEISKEDPSPRNQWFGDPTTVSKLCRALVMALVNVYGGMNSNAIYIVLPDFAKEYDSSIGTLSFLYTCDTFARLVSSTAFGSGRVSYKNPYYWVLVSVCLQGSVVMSSPSLSYIPILFTAQIVNGLAYSTLMTITDVECLRMWRGESMLGPLLQMNQLGLPLGAFLAPLFATQFFSGRGITFLDLNTLQCYFLVLGGSGIFLMPFLMYFGVRYEADSKYIYSNNNGSSAPNNADEEKMTPWTRNLTVIFFIAVYVQGAFWILGQQSPSFGVYSHFKMSMAQGTKLSTLFFGSSIVSMALVMCAFKRFPARAAIFIYLLLSTIPCVYVAARQNNLTLSELQACLVLAGAGSGPVYVASVVILEEYVPVGEKIIGWMLLADALSLKTIPPIIGQFIVRTPVVLFCTGAAAGSVCIAIFLCVEICRPRLLKKLAEEKKALDDSERCNSPVTTGSSKTNKTF